MIQPKVDWKLSIHLERSDERIEAVMANWKMKLLQCKLGQEGNHYFWSVNAVVHYPVTSRLTLASCLVDDFDSCGFELHVAADVPPFLRPNPWCNSAFIYIANNFEITRVNS